MAPQLPKLRVLSLLVVLVSGLAVAADGAEKRRFRWTHTARQTVSETRSIPARDLELVQGTYVDPVTAQSPEFDIVEARTVNQDDTFKGDGRHRGVEIVVFRNGDTAVDVYEGTHKILFRDSGAWEVTYQGTFEFVGGTGKYKHLTGHGTYRGHITPYGSLTEEAEAEVEY